VNAELITPAEADRLAELEKRIESNVAMVGRDLFEIRESRLYRQSHGTFEDYCQDRFQMSRNYINRQIQAAEVMNNLVPIGTKIPTNEAQARPLAKLPAEQQPAAWEKAQEIAKEEGKPVAARHVEAAVLEVMPKEEPETVVVDGVKFAIPNPTLSDEAKAKGDAAEKESDKLWLLKSTWKNTSKKDRSAFLAWASSK
jgi:hypothetical protein